MRGWIGSEANVDFLGLLVSPRLVLIRYGDVHILNNVQHG